mgnify:FL=1
MSASGYDLRAGLLGQAQSILENQFQAKYETLRYLCDRDLVDPKGVTWPEMPTSEAILAEAEKLYAFVQKK